MADWRKIKTEYITGDVSLRALAEKSGVSFSQLGKRAAAEKWKEQREKQRNKTETKAKQKAAEKISDAESDIAALKAESRRLLWEVTRDRIKGITKATEAADVRRYVQNYTDLLNSEPQGTGADEPQNNLFDQLEASLNFYALRGETSDSIHRQNRGTRPRRSFPLRPPLLHRQGGAGQRAVQAPDGLLSGAA